MIVKVLSFRMQDRIKANFQRHALNSLHASGHLEPIPDIYPWLPQVWHQLDAFLARWPYGLEGYSL
jgi:hypothetical protein